MHPRFTRRGFLVSSTALGGLIVASGCQPTAPTATLVPQPTAVPTMAPQPTAVPTTAPKPTAAPTVVVAKYKEAPALAALVAAGKLPPVEKRLPKNPLVVKPVDQVGKYGGAWHMVYTGMSDLMNFYEIADETVFRPAFDDPYRVDPNIAEAWKLSGDGKTLTINIREGLRWSDGELLTADDFDFWYHDVTLNEELSPKGTHTGLWLWVVDQLAGFKKLDNLTIQYTFPRPYPQSIKFLAAMWIQPFLPKHYLAQFHPKYTDQSKIEAAAKAAGFKNWWELFQDKGGGWWRYGVNPDVPNINPWIVTTPPSGTGRWVVQRNPYYFKVDTAGNQLPYIDEINWDLVENTDVVNLKAISGEVDMMFRYIENKNQPVLESEGKKNNYTVYSWDYPAGAGVIFNWTSKDPVLRKIFQDVNFRRGMSVAINRDEINKLMYNSAATPRQDAPFKGDELYDAKWEKDWTQYDAAAAGKQLDQAGLDKKDADGFRLRPDGKALTLTIEGGVASTDEATLITKYFQAVGVKTVWKVNDPSLLQKRGQAGDIDVQLAAVQSTFELLMEPYYAFPLGWTCAWGPQWGIWYDTKGSGGEEPPQAVKDLKEAYEATKYTVGADRDAAIKKIKDFFAGNVVTIGTIGGFPKIGVVKNYFKNVPKKAIWTNFLDSYGYTNPHQYYIDKG